MLTYHKFHVSYWQSISYAPNLQFVTFPSDGGSGLSRLSGTSGVSGLSGASGLSGTLQGSLGLSRAPGASRLSAWLRDSPCEKNIISAWDGWIKNHTAPKMEPPTNSRKRDVRGIESMSIGSKQRRNDNSLSATSRSGESEETDSRAGSALARRAASS